MGSKHSSYLLAALGFSRAPIPQGTLSEPPLPARTSTSLTENFITRFDTRALRKQAITFVITIRIGSIEARRAYRR